MKNLIAASLALVLSLAMAACGTTAPPLPDVSTLPTAPVPSGATPISEVAQKALYAAEAAYNIPAQAYVTLNRQNALPADVKAKAKPLLLDAYQALRAARLAAAAGDSAGVLLESGTASKLAAAAKALLPNQ